MKKIIVASANPVKIQTTKLGFSKMLPQEEFEISGISVPSGVADQPMSDEETLLGAQNRVKTLSTANPDADFWVGIEGGLVVKDNYMEAFAWVVIKSKNNVFGKGKTATFILPAKIVELIKQGKELGDADDIVFGKNNSKQANGAVGLLTRDVITRTSLYEQGVILALIPFKNATLY